MQRSQYFYCATPLGTLEKTPKGYKYTSNVRNEQRLKDAYLLIDSNYSLWNSTERENPELFDDMKKVLYTTRGDILELAGVTAEDSEWDMLVKIAQRPTFPSGFFLRTDDKEQTDDKVL